MKHLMQKEPSPTGISRAEKKINPDSYRENMPVCRSDSAGRLPRTCLNTSPHWLRPPRMGYLT